MLAKNKKGEAYEMLNKSLEMEIEFQAHMFISATSKAVETIYSVETAEKADEAITELIEAIEDHRLAFQSSYGEIGELYEAIQEARWQLDRRFIEENGVPLNCGFIPQV
jgi:hypothetical protein